jgi:hypothetical protein
MRYEVAPEGFPVCRALLTLSALVLLVSLTPAAPVPKGAGKPVYFPTQKGAKWTYTNYHNDQEETFVVTEVVEKGGEKIISVGREAKGEVTPAGKFKLTKEGVIESVGAWQLHHVRPLMLDRPVKPGDEWEEEVEAEGPGRAPLKWKVVVRGPEKVKVPAGTFEAIRVESTFTIKGIAGRPDMMLLSLTEWYAPGVGAIRHASEGKELGVLKSFTPGKE